ncbi:NUDIX hydrolase [uncultured Sneathiella sp.]|uniref:NUDIX hydrolase n=1 Tax=uncultured Sneathiella sp. TaxID=879315 RepID=UPI0030EFA016|tara:strand:+ start:96522 stop:97241 length:720 start_codon:yes stop_codon:yes gene_type:complete
MTTEKKRSVAESRTDGSKAPRPKDAATLILYRQSSKNTEILMGERSGRHSFMPNTYVFPGGRVDASDGRIPPARDLRDDVMARLVRGGCSPARARALAVAAIRETFEETGLRLAETYPAPRRSRVAIWNDFGTATCGPDLSKLDYIVRAVTPPSRKKRFNTRFFVADAETLEGTMKDSSELLDLRWVTIPEALNLDIPLITEHVIGHLDTFLKTRPERDANRPVPMFQMRHGKRIFAEE